MRNLIELDKSEINQLQYGVIVECWHKLRQPDILKEYFKLFETKERREAKAWYKVLYKWYIVESTPKVFVAHADDWDLVAKLAIFFSNIS